MPQNTTDCSAVKLLAENLQLVAVQLSTTGETSRQPQADFSLDDFWTRFSSLIKSLSAETTKLCLGFTSAPLPGADEQNYFTQRMQQMVLALVSAFYGLPKAYGTLLRKSTRLALFDVVSSLQTLLVSIATSGIQGASLEELTSTGEFWACCDRVDRLPRTNAAALRVVVGEEHGMVTDAFNEIETAKRDDRAGNGAAVPDPDILADSVEERLRIDVGDNRDEDVWSESDLTVVTAATALVKTVAFVLKKMGPPLKRAALSAMDKVEAIDDLAESVRKISPSVDDLVLVLYAPMNRDNVEKEVKTLHQCARDVLEKCKDLAFCEETEQNWISFLSDAADHNRKKTLDSMGLS